jgi:hypothetical protein
MVIIFCPNKLTSAHTNIYGQSIPGLSEGIFKRIQIQMSSVIHNIPCHIKHLLIFVSEGWRGSILKAG